MADIKIVGDDGKVVSDNIVKTELSSPSTIIPSTSLVLYQLAEVFDLKPSEAKLQKRKLETLLDYAKSKTSDHSIDSLKHQLRLLGTKLGSSKTGETPLSYMHRFAYLDLQAQRIKAEQDSYLKVEKEW